MPASDSESDFITTDDRHTEHFIRPVFVCRTASSCATKDAQCISSGHPHNKSNLSLVSLYILLCVILTLLSAIGIAIIAYTSSVAIAEFVDHGRALPRLADDFDGAL